MSEKSDALRSQLNTPWEELTQEERDAWNAIESTGIGASPSTEGEGGEEDAREAAKRIVDWDDNGRLADDEWLVERNETAIIAICRALLSSPRVEREWCLNCGTITRDHRCHCTEIGQEPHFVNYADELARQMNAAASSPREERARALEEAAQIADIYVAYAPATEDGDEAARKIGAAIRSLSPTDGAPANPPKVRTP